MLTGLTWRRTGNEKRSVLHPPGHQRIGRAGDSRAAHLVLKAQRKLRGGVARKGLGIPVRSGSDSTYLDHYARPTIEKVLNSTNDKLELLIKAPLG
jgi:hypothetical protein